MTRQLAAAAAAAVLLVGCGVAPSDPQPIDSAAPFVVPSPLDDEAKFLIAARAAADGGWDGVSDENLLELGYGTCDQLDTITVEQMQDRFAAAIMQGAEITTEQVGSLMGASIGALCPEHQQ